MMNEAELESADVCVCVCLNNYSFFNNLYSQDNIWMALAELQGGNIGINVVFEQYEQF